MTDTFPRQYARTQRFTLGEPRNVTVSPDGRRVVFARSRGGSDPVNRLWVMDARTGDERLVADPLLLLIDADEQDLPPEERARRERAREGAGGVVAFATNRAATVAAFALSGRLFVAGLVSAAARELRAVGPVFDPRPEPTDEASRIAYVSGATLRVAELDGQSWELAGEEGVRWGSADFVAAEEMGRSRGFWWSPDGARIAVCRVDDSDVRQWWIADPARPDQEPRPHRYPAAGTTNPSVELHVLALDGGSVPVGWDHERYPYLATVTWVDDRRLLLGVQSRDQRTFAVLEADGVTGESSERWIDTDDAWVELVPGVPAELDDGRLVVCADRDGVRRLMVGGEPVTDTDLQVRSVVDASGDRVVFLANPIHDPTVLLVHRWSAARGVEALVDEPGVHGASVGGPTTVVRSATLHEARARTRVLGGPAVTGLGESPLIEPNVSIVRLGEDGIVGAILLPREVAPDASLPVLLDPYGGPHAQRVTASLASYASSQWFADQGFAVVIADGRGTPGRGSAWERAVHRDLAGPVLDDQIVALRAAARHCPQLDLSRVAIRGWSFGGYLAALAVLRAPHLFHAAIAGAPVTDWRLYDTHYTERYLGDPSVDPAPYDRSSLLADAHCLERPLLLIHGLADDNVVSAHTLQLSSALLAAGRPHQVLPLSGVSHMTPQEVVAENLLLLQLQFLRDALGLESPAATEAAESAASAASEASQVSVAPATPVDPDYRHAVLDELQELYRGVAVHATADVEHEAALEVLLLMMLADGKIRIDEQDEIDTFVQDHAWESDTFSLETRIGPAMARARLAATSPAAIETLLDDVDARIASTVLRAELIAACRQIADADHERAATEDRVLAGVISRFG